MTCGMPPSREIIHLLQCEHACVKAYDPVATPTAARLLSGVELCTDPYEVAKDSDALVIVTEWNEFKELDLVRVRSLMRQPILLDGRNIYQPAEANALGFTYLGVGRPRQKPNSSPERPENPDPIIGFARSCAANT